MTASRREELNKRNLINLCESLNRYIEGGGTLHVETVHGESSSDNRIIMTVADWDAFRAALETGTPLGES